MKKSILIGILAGVLRATYTEGLFIYCCFVFAKSHDLGLDNMLGWLPIITLIYCFLLVIKFDSMSDTMIRFGISMALFLVLVIIFKGLGIEKMIILKLLDIDYLEFCLSDYGFFAYFREWFIILAGFFTSIFHGLSKYKNKNNI